MYVDGTLVLEDGSGYVDANSYASIEHADNELQTHPDYTLVWYPATSSQKASALINGTFYLDCRFRWYGWSKTESQSLGFPRTRVYSRRGVVYLPGVIPAELIKATCLVGIKWLSKGTLFNSLSEKGPAQSIAAGITVEYNPTILNQQFLVGVRMTEVEQLLRSIGEFKEKEFYSNRITEVRN